MSLAMNRARSRWWACVFGISALGGLSVLACDSSSPSEVLIRDASEIQPLVLNSSGPAIYSDWVSFFAVAGETRKAELFFQDSSGQKGERLLRFEVDDDALYQYPDGTRIQEGDSVLITIRISNPGSLQFDFEPSGLTFSTQEPAELEVRYGQVQGLTQDEVQLAVWMQETTGAPYQRLRSRVDPQRREVEADVPGFSKYAVAY